MSSVGDVAVWMTGMGPVFSVGCLTSFASGSSGVPPVSGSPAFASRICFNAFSREAGGAVATAQGPPSAAARIQPS